MLQCLDGVKHLCGVLLKCCDIDLKQPKGLEDPQAGVACGSGSRPSPLATSALCAPATALSSSAPPPLGRPSSSTQPTRSASILRAPVFTDGLLCFIPGVVLHRSAVAKSGGDAKQRAVKYRLSMALLGANDGHIEEARDAVAGLARKRPANLDPRLAAAALFYLLGQTGDGEEWLEGIPEAARRGNASCQRRPVVSSLTGKGIDALLAWPASRLREATVLSALGDGNLSVEEMLEISMFASLLQVVRESLGSLSPLSRRGFGNLPDMPSP